MLRSSSNVVHPKEVHTLLQWDIRHVFLPESCIHGNQWVLFNSSIRCDYLFGIDHFYRGVSWTFDSGGPLQIFTTKWRLISMGWPCNCKKKEIETKIAPHDWAHKAGLTHLCLVCSPGSYVVLCVIYYFTKLTLMILFYFILFSSVFLLYFSTWHVLSAWLVFLVTMSVTTITTLYDLTI